MNLRISPSQTSTFFGCPASYYQRYILGRRVPPSIFLAIGTGLDEAANVNFIQKQATRTDLPVEYFEDAAADAFDKRVRESGLLLTREQAARSKDFIAESKAMTVNLARALCKLVAPLIQPIAVQGNIEFTRDANPGVIHVGKFDVMDETHDVIDVKSAKGRWPSGKASGEEQPTFYLHGAKETMGAKPSKFVYHILTKKPSPVHHVVTTTRDESDLEALDQRISTMVAMRQAGLFPPCDSGHWRCSVDWCPFYIVGCKYISKRRRMFYLSPPKES